MKKLEKKKAGYEDSSTKWGDSMYDRLIADWLANNNTPRELIIGE